MRKIKPEIWLMLTGLVILFGHHGGYWSEHWASKWALLLGMGIIAFGGWFSEKTHILFGITLTYFMLSAWAIGIWPQNIYVGALDVLTLIALEKNCIYALLVMFAGGILFAKYTKELSSFARLILFTIYSVSTLYTLIQVPGWPARSGFFSGNPSMNGCLIAALYPTSWQLIENCLKAKRRKYAHGIVFALTAFAIYRTSASVPYGVLAAVIGIGLLQAYGMTLRAWGLVTFAMGGILASGFLILKSDYLENNGRYNVWHLMFEWAHLYSNVWTGAGIGVSQVLVPAIQAVNTRTDDYFLWFHNDWLQIFFESGLIGSALLIGSVAILLKRCYRERFIMPMLGGFFAMGSLNYPLRLPIHSYCLALIVCEAWWSSRPSWRSFA